MPRFYLHTLKCKKPEDWTGPDEPYLSIRYGPFERWIFGVVKEGGHWTLDDGEEGTPLTPPYRRGEPLDTARKNWLDLFTSFPEAPVIVTLYDADLGPDNWVDKDDNLGTREIPLRGTGGHRTVDFTGDGASYTLTYSIE